MPRFVVTFFLFITEWFLAKYREASQAMRCFDICFRVQTYFEKLKDKSAEPMCPFKV